MTLQIPVEVSRDNGASVVLSPDERLIVYATSEPALHLRRIDQLKGAKSPVPRAPTVRSFLRMESGRDEVYLKRFPTAEGIWMLSLSGGADPFWSKDGKELYYWQSSDLMAVEVDSTGNEPQRSDPQRLFSANDIDVLVNGRTDVSRFLMIQRATSEQGEDTRQRAIVVIEKELVWGQAKFPDPRPPIPKFPHFFLG